MLDKPEPECYDAQCPDAGRFFQRLQMKEEETEMKKYAKLLSLVLALAMAFSLMATGTAFADDAKPELPEFETVTAGKLTVATSPDFAPYEF